MSKYKFIIDCRENFIAGWYTSNVKDENIEIKQLPTSDFMFMRDEKPFICIERKRIDDFASSIVDGRYKTQKHEMIKFANEHTPRPFLVYLVEQLDVLDDEDYKSAIKNTSITKETVVSAITKTLFRDNFGVIFSKDTQDSIRWLNKVWGNLCKGEFDCLSEGDIANQYMDNSQRKHNKTVTIDADEKLTRQQRWWLMSLTNIDGISIAKSRHIVSVYPTVESLLQAYDGCATDKDRYLLLADIKINNRRLGDVASRAVYESLKVIDIDVPTPTTQKQKSKPKNPKPKKDDNQFDECLL